MKLVFLITATFIIFASAVSAWGFHDAMGNGTPIICITPKQSAMGGVWALPSSEAASIFLNPAELSMMDGTSIKITTAIAECHSYTSAELDYDHLNTGNFGTVTAALGTEISETVSIAAGLSRVSHFGFSGISNILEEYGYCGYKIYATDLLDSRGSLWEANTGISVVISDWLTAGVSGGMRFGNGSYTLRHDIVNPIAPDDTTEVSWEESDFCFHAGLLMPFSFGTFGISGTNKTGRYDSRIAFGFQRDFNILNGSTLGVEFDLQSLEEKNPAVSGKTFICLAEMLPNVRSTYNVGFVRATDYNRAALCLGTGTCIYFGRMNLDMAISWMSRSRSGYAFPEPYISNIDDSETYYSAGLSWNL
ncbi:MAG: hypothetical protein K8S15_12995 [Candidatus Aegiribacteria sp.]|nr:hypothetical protein [Candidatus Aegiribacteria sp.]